MVGRWWRLPRANLDAVAELRLAFDHVLPRETIVTHGLRAALDAFEDHLA